jgi:pimeloyl-ACP methyl ester carboxylesterase
MPSVPSSGALIEFFSKKGYWVFCPRYRGTWESGGRFLKYPPDKDVLDIVDGLPRGFKDAYGGKKYQVRHPEIYLIGSSFGGPAAILASQDARVKKVALISPVIDWRADSKIEPLSLLERTTRDAFGEAYRFSDFDWKKLEGGKFYNPATCAWKINGKKLLIVHAKDDKYVLWRPVLKFSKQTGARLMLFKRGGHLSASIIMKPKFYKHIKKFFVS